jgi:hypothetical protein
VTVFLQDNEPNDDYAHAFAVTISSSNNFTGNGSVQSISPSFDYQDYYKFHLTRAATLVVSVSTTSDTSNGPATGSLFGSSSSAYDQYNITTNRSIVLQPDDYYLVITDGRTNHPSPLTYTVQGSFSTVNAKPIANGESYSTNKNTPLTISAPGVLGNDTDADFDGLTAVLASNPSHGSVSFNANGSFTYTPTANYTGPDSFTYFANDGLANSATAAQVSITVASEPHVVPSVNVQNVSVAANTEVAAALLIASVSNPSGDIITAYEFIDQGNGGGYFKLGNTIEPANQWFEVLTGDISSLKYVGGSSAGSETLAVAVYDYTTNSYSNASTLTATTTAPTSPDFFVVGDHLNVATGRAGSNITFSYWVDNFGAPAPASKTGIYLSTDSVITSSDTLLTFVNTPELTALSGSHGTDFHTVGIVIPAGLAPGQYFIGAIADYDRQIVELSESNNASVGIPFAVVPVRTDFNGDGRSDILWRNDSGAVATWNMNDRSSNGAVIGTATNDWHIAGTGDFNGDGKADVLWRNDSGAVATWNMNDRSSNGAVIGTATNDWHIAGTGDFNGDGRSDILWRNDTGAVATWNMNDHSSNGAVIGIVTNDWHIV